jgi:hypothetical protein
MADEETEQTRFRDGRVVRPPDAVARAGADGPVPNERRGFVLSIEPGAVAVNAPLASVVDEHGTTVTFGSRVEAEAFAERYAARDGALRVQAAAPTDDREVDAYLLADHDPSVRTPAAVDGETATFDVGANLYGTLGETVVTAGPAPALERFVRRDLTDVPVRDGLEVAVRDGEALSPGVLAPHGGDRTGGADGDDKGGDGAAGQWLPDCRVEARDGVREPPIETYYCEIKTGGGSLERSQAAAMRTLARTGEVRVLRVDVAIDALPDRYDVRIAEVGTDESTGADGSPHAGAER